MAATTPNTWKAKMDERRQQEESKKRAAIVAVNDISFPALGGGAGGGAGWGAPEAAPPPPLARSKTGVVTSYSQTIKAAAEAAEAPMTVATSTRDQMAELSVFRHRPAPQFGTSRSSREDTYYDDVRPAEPETYDDGWSTIDKKKPVTKSRIDYSSNLTDEDYGEAGGNHDASNTLNTNW
jgi:hypothetical protein